MTRRRSEVRGFMSLDVTVSIALTALLALAFTAAFRQCARAQRLADSEMDLRIAAEAELTRLCAAGVGSLPGVTSSPPAGDIELETTMRPGAGVWRGLTHVTVVARQRVEAGWLRVQLSAYIPTAEAQP